MIFGKGAMTDEERKKQAMDKKKEYAMQLQ
jgi:hypothetical protein